MTRTKPVKVNEALADFLNDVRRTGGTIPAATLEKYLNSSPDFTADFSAWKQAQELGAKHGR